MDLSCVECPAESLALLKKNVCNDLRQTKYGTEPANITSTVASAVGVDLIVCLLPVCDWGKADGAGWKKQELNTILFFRVYVLFCFCFVMWSICLYPASALLMTLLFPVCLFI